MDIGDIFSDQTTDWDLALASCLELESAGVEHVAGVRVHSLRGDINCGRPVSAALAIASARLLRKPAPDPATQDNGASGPPAVAVEAAKEAADRVLRAVCSLVSAVDDAKDMVDSFVLSLPAGMDAMFRLDWALSKRGLESESVSAISLAEACSAELDDLAEDGHGDVDDAEEGGA